jgi:hypothetical protein
VSVTGYTFCGKNLALPLESMHYFHGTCALKRRTCERAVIIRRLCDTLIKRRRNFGDVVRRASSLSPYE